MVKLAIGHQTKKCIARWAMHYKYSI